MRSDITVVGGGSGKKINSCLLFDWDYTMSAGTAALNLWNGWTLIRGV